MSTLLLHYLTHIDIYPFIITLLSLFLVLFAYVKQGFYTFIFLFSTAFVLFNSSRYMLHLFDFIDVREVDYFANYTLSDEVYEIQSTLLIFFISTLTWFVSSSKVAIKSFKLIEVNSYQKTFISLVFFISLLSQIYKVNFLLSYSQSVGYIAFQGNYSNYISQVPAVFRYFSYLFLLSYFLFIMTNRLNERQFKLISLLYLLVLAYSTSLGGRALFFTNLFVVIWLYGQVFNKRSMPFGGFVFISLLLFSMLALSQLIVAYRMGSNDSFNAFHLISSILFDQGTTITVFSLVQKVGSVSGDLNVMFDHIMRYFYMPFSGVLSYFGLGFYFYSFVEVVAKHLDPVSFESGYGLGGNIMAELYLYFGWASIFVFYWVLKLYKSISEMRTSSYFFILIPVAMQGIFFSPRSYVFEFIIEVGRVSVYVLVLIFFLWLLGLMTNRKERSV